MALKPIDKMTCEEVHANVRELIAELGITMNCVYIPCDIEGMKQEDWRFSYKITLNRYNVPFLLTNYSMGIAHSPTYEAKMGRLTLEDVNGKRGLRYQLLTGMRGKQDWQLIRPNIEDVMYCVTLDGDLANNATFEEWAGEFGYDSDSIKAKAIYDQCVTTGRALRLALSSENITRLQEAFQGF